MRKDIKGYIESGISMAVTTFDGVKPMHSKEVLMQDIVCNANMTIEKSNWKIECNIEEMENRAGAYQCSAVFEIITGELINANVSVGIALDNWSTDNYVLMPAAAYNGNRFKVVRKDYPPMLNDNDGIGEVMPLIMNDNPRLEINEGPSKIHLRSGDLATPCVSIQFAQEQAGLQLLAEHNTPYGYTGFQFSESEDRKSAYLKLEAPAVREQIYRGNRTDVVSDDVGCTYKAGDKVELKFNLYLFSCPDISALFDVYCDTRKDLSGEVMLHQTLPFEAALRISEKKYNEFQWNDEFEYYKIGPSKNKFEDWQAGWVGGGMNSLAFLMEGEGLSKERACKTMDAIFSTLQHESGFIYGIVFEGQLKGDDYYHMENANFLLLRKNADLLVFAARHIFIKQKRNEVVPMNWLEGYKKLADAFVRLWNKYQQFGQFINIEKEEILIGGTASAGIAVGGLALAYQLYGDLQYLETATKAADYYYQNYILKGITNGGPGEILQAPDSESAFGLLESYVILYEVSGDKRWLPIAEACAKQCASWCMSYDFEFPEGSVFGQLNMHAAGSVYANVQNKCSTPGICTLSGVSLVKLYRATGNKFYLQLIKEIAHNITQYLSREDRPIFSWDEKYLPAGWMCERVNTCDWEGKKNIGGVFHGSCWCEISMLLTYCEIPGIWFLADTGEVTVFDHVEVEITDRGDCWLLLIKNTTKFDTIIKLYVESTTDLATPWGECKMEECIAIGVKANEAITYCVEKV